MVIAIEIFFGSKRGELLRQGSRIEDLVVVTKDGYENLAR
jgi:Xaa-Pro aminopeptidase